MSSDSTPSPSTPSRDRISLTAGLLSSKAVDDGPNSNVKLLHPTYHSSSTSALDTDAFVDDHKRPIRMQLSAESLTIITNTDDRLVYACEDLIGCTLAQQTSLIVR